MSAFSVFDRRWHPFRRNRRVTVLNLVKNIEKCSPTMNAFGQYSIKVQIVLGKLMVTIHYALSNSIPLEYSRISQTKGVFA